MIALLAGGLQIAYDDVGAGLPVLFIHGWPHDRTLWAAQLRGLPAGARCIAPDLRGFGDSTVEGPFSIDGYADDLALFLQSLGIERAVLSGLSMGGYIALAMLRRHRAMVRGLILTSETTFTTRPDVLEAMRSLMARAPAEGVTGALQAMADRRDATDVLAGIDVPTLVVSGAEDTIIPPDEMRSLADAIPKSRLEVILGGGHVCPYERPAAFNHVVGEYLARLAYD